MYVSMESRKRYREIVALDPVRLAEARRTGRVNMPAVWVCWRCGAYHATAIETSTRLMEIGLHGIEERPALVIMAALIRAWGDASIDRLLRPEHFPPLFELLRTSPDYHRLRSLSAELAASPAHLAMLEPMRARWGASGPGDPEQRRRPR